MIYSLQLLRFLAASLVVLSHSMGEFSDLKTFGLFGVDIFFVISGFIISHITQANQDNFLSKRLIRIVPQYWLFTFVIAAIAYFSPDLLRSAKWDVSHVLSSLFFVPWWTETTRFSPILILGWTLNFEMFFYLLFYFSMKLNVRYKEIICSCAIVFISIILNAIELDERSFLYFYSNTIVYEFIFGMAIALLYKERRWLFEKIPPIVISAVLLTVFYVYYHTSLVMNFNLPRIVYWGIPAFACVFIFIAADSYVKKFDNKVLSAFLLSGEISYPLYLIHMYFIAALSRLLHGVNLGPYQIFFLSLFMSSVASYFLLKFYDAPVRNALTRLLTKRHKNWESVSATKAIS